MIEIVNTGEWLQIYKDGAHVDNVGYMFDSDGWLYVDRLIDLLRGLGFEVIYYTPSRLESFDPDEVLKEARRNEASK